MTIASPQPADPLVKPMNSAEVTAGPGEGEMLAMTPFSHWSARTSRSHFRENPVTSYRYAAVGRNSCQSPVQPAFSRCGQSVGTSQELPRKLHSTMSWSLFSRSSLQLNEPMRSRSVRTRQPVMSPGCRSCVEALDGNVLEAVGGVAGFEGFAGGAGGDDGVHLAGVEEGPW